jgi:hypothetical protein
LFYCPDDPPAADLGDGAQQPFRLPVARVLGGDVVSDVEQPVGEEALAGLRCTGVTAQSMTVMRPA